MVSGSPIGKTNKGRSATLIVAASNASPRSKRGADYVCDGTADNVEINAAINYLTSLGGGKIILTEGRFNLSAKLPITSSNITIEGMGHSTILYLNNNVNDHVIEIGNGGTSTIYGVVLKNFQINGNKTHQTAGDGIFCNLYIWDSFFEKLYIQEVKSNGIHLYGTVDTNGSRRNTIKECNIEYSGNDNIKIEYCHHTRIRGCTNIWGAGNDGISLYYSNSTQITDISVFSSTRNALYLMSSAQCNVKYANLDSAESCLKIQEGGRNSFIHVMIENSTEQGLYLFNTVRNYFYACMAPYGAKFLVLISASQYNHFTDCYIGSGSTILNDYKPCVNITNVNSIYNQFNGCHFDLVMNPHANKPTYALSEEESADYTRVLYCDFGSGYTDGKLNLTGVHSVSTGNTGI